MLLRPNARRLARDEIHKVAHSVIHSVIHRELGGAKRRSEGVRARHNELPNSCSDLVKIALP